jgi:hypothetical protein
MQGQSDLSLSEGTGVGDSLFTVASPGRSDREAQNRSARAGLDAYVARPSVEAALRARPDG